MNKQLLILLLGVIGFTANGQIGTKSPYSYYGIGDETRSYLTSQASMGHTSIAVKNPLNINVVNPAGLSQLGRVTFNFDVKNEFLTLNNGAGTQSSSLLGINNISFGFPLINNPKSKRRATWAFGIKPYTQQGYSMNYQDSIAELGTGVDYMFTGDGTVSDAFMGLSYDLLASNKRIEGARKQVLSIGATASYLFGTVERTRITQFGASTLNTNVYRETSMIVSDVNFKWGFLYSHLFSRRDSVLNKKTKAYEYLDKKVGYLSIGGFFTPQTGLNTSFYNYNRTYLGTYTNPTVLDTLAYSNTRGTMGTPASYGLGLSFNYMDQWTFAMDAVRTEWSKLTLDGVNQNLADANRLSFGVEYIPDYSSATFTKTIRYRAGLSAEQTRLIVDGQQLGRYGINFGIGVPLLTTSSTSMFNLGLEVANRGNANIGGLNETFVNLNVGFTFTPNVKYDFWFFKRKYD